jgi:DNA polymerase III delta prime subunit
MIVDTNKKYTPKTLDEFVYPNEEVKRVITQYASGEIARPLILHGTNGCGKSLLLELLPNAIENTTAHVTRVLCSDLNDANDVHRIFGINTRFNAMFKYNEIFDYFIIDEFNITNKKVVDALKIQLDRNLGRALTIISTNRLDLIDVGIQSRCKVLEVPPCTPSVFMPHALKIFNGEKLTIDDAKLKNFLDDVYKKSRDNRKYYERIEELLWKAE